jgi:8-oxo-dGTP pyrophosphatase MutT (NUDIX family)
VLLIERTDGGVHGGQVALPGGNADSDSRTS